MAMFAIAYPRLPALTGIARLLRASRERPSSCCAAEKRDQLPPLHEAIGAEVLFKLVESANRDLDLENEVFVCENCGREVSYIVNHDKYAGRPAADVPHTDATIPEVLTCRGEMATPKFKLGQTVFLQHNIGNRGATNGIYEVTRQLPERNAEFEYQIKSSREPHERVVRE